MIILITEIPYELIKEIFKYMKAREIILFEWVSDMENIKIERDNIWSYMVKRDYGITDIDNEKYTWYEYYKYRYNTQEEKIKRYTENINIDNLLRLGNIVLEMAKELLKKMGQKYNNANIIPHIEIIWKNILLNTDKNKLFEFASLYTTIINNIVNNIISIDIEKYPFCNKTYFIPFRGYKGYKFGKLMDISNIKLSEWGNYVTRLPDEQESYTDYSKTMEDDYKKTLRYTANYMFYLGISHYYNFLLNPYIEIDSFRTLYYSDDCYNYCDNLTDYKDNCSNNFTDNTLNAIQFSLDDYIINEQLFSL